MTCAVPDHPDRDAALELLHRVGPEAAGRVAELTVFAPDEPLPVDSVTRLWARTADWSASAAERLCAQLLDVGLLVGAGGAPPRVLVPALAVDLLAARLRGRETGLHEAVVESHRSLVPVRDGASSWADLEVEYLWRRLPEHLLSAGRPDELAALLDDPRWVLGRMDRVDGYQLGSELRESSPHLPRRALAAVVTCGTVWPDLPDAVPLRLAARTPPEDEEARERADAALVEEFASGGPDLEAPYLFTLHHVTDAAALGAVLPGEPAGALLRALSAGTGRVTAPDGTWSAAAGDRPEVRLSDPRTGVLLHTLHTPGVGRPTALAVSPDGSWLASADRTGRVALWRPLHVLGTRRPPVRGPGRSLPEGAPAPGPDDPAVLAVRHHLADWRGADGADGAVAAFTELAADLARRRGPDDPTTLSARHSLARWRGAAGDTGGAVAAHADLLADRVRVLGADHPRTLASRHDLACARGDDGDAAGALDGLTSLVADHRRVLGPDHPETLAVRANLAHWRRAAGADADDDPDDPTGDHLGRVFEDHVRVLGPDHPATADLRRHLVHWLAARGRPDRAAAVGAPMAHERFGTGPGRRVAQLHLARWCADAEEGTVGVYRELLRPLPPSATRTAAEAAARLREEERDRLDELVVFHEPVADEVVDRFWAHTAGWSAAQGRELRGRLVGLGLLDGAAGGAGRTAVPGPVRDHLDRRTAGRRARMHRALVDAHRDLVPVSGGASRWSALDPAHAYWWLHLPSHLEAAGLPDERDALVDDPRWVVDALDRRGPSAVAAELERGSDPARRAVAQLLRREVHLLDPLDPPGSLAATLGALPQRDGRGRGAVEEFQDRLLGAIAGPHLARVDREVAGAGPLWSSDDVGPGPAGLVAAPDGSWLAAVCEGVHFWDPVDGRHLDSFEEWDYIGTVEHFDGRAYAAAPDGSVLAVAYNWRVGILDLRDGVERHGLDNSDGFPEARLTFAPDGSWLAVTSFDTVRVWNPDTGQLLAELDGHYSDVQAVVAAPDSSWVATTSVDTTDGGWRESGTEPDLAVRIWDPRSGEVLHTLDGTEGEVVGLGVAPDGSWLVTTGERVQLWDPATGALTHTVDEPDCDPRSGVLAVAPDGSCVAYAGRQAGTLVIREPGGALLQALTTAGGVAAIAFSPDGRQLVTAVSPGAGGEVQLWDVRTGELAAALPGTAPIAVAPDGTWLAVRHDTGDEDTRVVLWPLGAVPRHRPGTTTPPVAASPDGTWTATADDDGTLRVRDPATGRALTALRVGFPPTGLEIDDGGRLLVRQDDAVHTFVLVDGGPGPHPVVGGSSH